jgi:hypothetical protein
MPIWKFSSSDEGGGQTALEDMSLNLSAYYQDLTDLGTFLRAHNGEEFEDLVMGLAAAGWTTEDLGSYLAAFLQSMEDMGLSLGTWGTDYQDMKTWLAAYYQVLEGDQPLSLNVIATGYEFFQTCLIVWATAYEDLSFTAMAYGQERKDLLSSFNIAGYDRDDLVMLLQAVSSTVFGDFGIYLSITDGGVTHDLGMQLMTMANLRPSSHSVYQRLTSIMKEVS